MEYMAEERKAKLKKDYKIMSDARERGEIIEDEKECIK